MEKTIKQLADELGISKQRIHQVIANLPSTEKPKKQNNKYLLNKENIKVIKSFVENKSSTEKRQVVINLSSIEKQLHVKDMQLEEKDKQIKQLQKILEDQQNLLSQQQQLQLMEQKKMHLLLDEAKQEVDQQTTIQKGSAKEENKGFFSRLFTK